MRGLDTNVLVRYLVADDPEQAREASLLLRSASGREPQFHVSVIALVELVWVLRTSHRLDRPALAQVIQALLGTPALEIQDRDLVRSALDTFRNGPADFSDYLLGELDRRAGCRDTMTFDRKLAEAPGFALLG